MLLVPEALRYGLVRETTERVIEQWHLERGLNVPEYSYCLHDRDTSDDRLQNLHTHVFVAGTIENGFGERESHRVKREQVVADVHSLERPDNLHHIARQEFETLLDRTIGKAWRLEREQRLEQEQEHRSIDLERSTSLPRPRLDIDF